MSGGGGGGGAGVASCVSHLTGFSDMKFDPHKETRFFKDLPSETKYNVVCIIKSCSGGMGDGQAHERAGGVKHTIGHVLGRASPREPASWFIAVRRRGVAPPVLRARRAREQVAPVQARQAPAVGA